MATPNHWSLPVSAPPNAQFQTSCARESRRDLQKSQRLAFAMLDLVHRALTRVFVGSPAQKSCAVSKPAAGKMIVRNFDDYFRGDGFPFGAALCAPPTRSSGCVACESRWFLQRFKFFR